MTDPAAPQIPQDAPQDVKDFFDCKSDKLEWKKGSVTWLGLPVNPDVSFGPGSNNETVDITVTVGVPPFGQTFTLPATVNAAGELTVGTTNVPDLSTLGLGGPQDVAAAIQRINDWFKKNGKKLKPLKLKAGALILEKTPIGVAVPPVVPAKPEPPKPVPGPPPVVAPPTGTTEEPKKSGGWCSMLFVLLLGLLALVVVVGASIGFALMGGVADQPFNTLPPPSFATVAPTSTPRPTSTSTPAPVPTPTTAAFTLTPAATDAGPAAPALGQTCIRVVHEPLGTFVSHIDWAVFAQGDDVDFLVLTVEGANGDAPMQLDYDPAIGAYVAQLGLAQAGPKTIVSLVARMTDGSNVDLTDELIERLGSDELNVRFPQEDTFGECPSV